MLVPVIKTGFLFLLLANVVAGAKDEKLVLVHAIYRHGDRTVDPTTIYPTDPYKDEQYYPVGLGELTNEGKVREYLLGKFLRSRYNKFLGPYYTLDVVDPRSSSYNRTKASLELVLAGLFPPVGIQVWNQELPWQPIPFNYLAAEEDTIFLGTSACPNNALYQQEYLQSAEGEKQYEQYKEIFQYLTEHSGLNVTDATKALLIYSCLFSEEGWGFVLPEWTKAVYPEPISTIAGIGYADFTGSTPLKKINAGAFFQKIVQDSKQKINGTLSPQDRKLFLYSGHDSNVAAVLNTLGLFDPPLPPFYGSCVVFEIYEIQNEYVVRVFHRQHTYAELELKTIPGCDTSCPLDQFERIVEKYYLDQSVCGNV